MKERRRKVYNIFIVEDDSTLRGELSKLLENSGYRTCELEEFSDPVGSILASDCDLVLLDINIPGINGELVLRELRKKTDIPVIMVTSRVSEADEVLSMSYGADDYVCKPYNPTILLLRISAVLKRSSGASSQQTYRGLTVDTAKGSLSSGDRELILTKNEMIIFRLLLERSGKIVSRDDLMTALWDNDEYVNDNALSVNVSRLRSKLGDFGYPDAIETRKKQGYVLK